MGLFGKKKKEVSEQKAFELPEPPSFEIQRIKESIFEKKESEELPELPELPELSIPSFPEKQKAAEVGRITKPATMEIQGNEPIISTQFTPSFTSRVHSTYAAEKEEEEKEEGEVKAVGPIFVKIDKFKDALTNFETIKKKLNEVDTLLKRIKEIRAREEESFDYWEKEIEEIKEKIESIDRRLFSKIG